MAAQPEIPWTLSNHLADTKTIPEEESLNYSLYFQHGGLSQEKIDELRSTYEPLLSCSSRRLAFLYPRAYDLFKSTKEDAIIVLYNEWHTSDSCPLTHATSFVFERVDGDTYRDAYFIHSFPVPSLFRERGYFDAVEELGPVTRSPGDAPRVVDRSQLTLLGRWSWHE